MHICGLQKVTLLDFPEKVACTIFTGGCNMRCPFCHNASLISSIRGVISLENIFAYLERRRGVLDAVCISGGEPLMQTDLLSFITRVKDMGYLVKLDTNGSFPKALAQMLEDNLLDYVAMDIKSSLAEYGKVVGKADFDTTPIRESVELLLKNTVRYEFRTTLVRPLHTKESIRGAAELICGAERYFLQSFAASPDILAPAGLSAFSLSQMREFLEIAAPYVKNVYLRET
ncbi:MAG: anaerobic ribonucleoside-triphosphate reductase activating protein [Clostridia bacterium]|nr:anaerobic ribonucleoside-triphosphate reductase activating protein [Clostridia bacterium]